MMAKVNYSKLFRMAWEAARHAKNVFGGKASEYFAMALKAQWTALKIRQAKEAETEKQIAAEMAASQVTKKQAMNNREFNDIEVTLTNIEFDLRVEYGEYYNYYFETTDGKQLVWHTCPSGYRGSTAYKLNQAGEGSKFLLSFNKRNDGKINYVTAKAMVMA